jgi:lipoic acid synthetase
MRPKPVDLDEPARLVASVKAMKLKHVVITSVARDDLDDGGALHFARCIEALRSALPLITIEVLVPDFLGNFDNLAVVTSLSPHIFNHNIETVRRLTPKVRSKARYDRSLTLLAMAKKQNPKLVTKSGLMLGLGEDDEEVVEALHDLRAHEVDQLTIGQYLRPSAWHHPIHRYASLELFSSLKIVAINLGFSHVESGPLVRSSYHAEKGVVT